jgi:taurine dehydrogenase small subunit
MRPYIRPVNPERTRMSDAAKDSEEALSAAIARYNHAWNAHDLDAIMSMHAPDMVFENHTAGESASGEAARAHIGSIFETWPDIEFSTRRLYVRQGLVVQEWTAAATHAKTMRRGDLVAEPTGRRVEWDGLDVIPFENGLVKRKDVYSDSVSILRQVGLID